jgi:RNA recognition motif-containing protein
LCAWTSKCLVGNALALVLYKAVEMTKRLFVRNFPFSMSEQALQELFARTGPVLSVKVPVDHETGRVRGFAFIDMQTAQDAARATEHLNGTLVGGRQLVVEAARERNVA